MINLQNLKDKVPEEVLLEIPEIIKKFEINTPLRLAHFLGQASHESGGFRSTTENLNYSSIGLLEIFPKYFNKELANLYGRKPEKIANIVYGNRMGNGDKSTGDGWKFRGRGYIQLTGRSNYVEFSKAIIQDVTSNPDLVATKYPLLSAAWFFNKTGLNLIADRGDSIDIVTMITKKINGGVHGIENRIKKFREYYSILN
jgi:putative chitinase